MTYNQLLRLINKGESQTLDFKRKVSTPYKTAKTLTSFANTRGGLLLIGVDDDKQIIGIDPDEEKFKIGEALSKHCSPRPKVSFLAIESDEGKTVLIVDVEECADKPVRVITSDLDKKVYVRMNDKSILASAQLIKNMQKGIIQPPKKGMNKIQSVLYDYLVSHEKITVKQYAKLCNFSERRAKRILIEQSVNGFLISHDLDKEVYYGLA